MLHSVTHSVARTAACALLLAMLAGVVPSSAASLVQVAAALLLVGSVFAAVHHAEIIALKVGEPFGTLVLALAVTVIECSLIVSMMLSGGESTSALARDTVYATVMIVCNGVLGLCLFAGSLRHHVVSFRAEGTVPAVAGKLVDSDCPTTITRPPAAAATA